MNKLNTLRNFDETDWNAFAGAEDLCHTSVLHIPPQIGWVDGWIVIVTRNDDGFAVQLYDDENERCYERQCRNVAIAIALGNVALGCNPEILMRDVEFVRVN